MKRTAAIVSLIALAAMCTAAYALYDVSDTGDWPQDWPKEMEPLRKQARTLVGPTLPSQHFAIRFEKREDFEAAWPHILKVKTEGAPIVLVRGENFFLGKGQKAGVIIHTPPAGQKVNPDTPKAPKRRTEHPALDWFYANYIELVVDGEIVDLNRIPLPEDTPIIDRRFKKEKE